MAVSTGHGGNFPDPAATTPAAPGMGANNGYGTAPSAPAAPGMGTDNGYNGYGTSATAPAAPGTSANNGYSAYDPNRVAPAPAQTPGSGMPATDVPATSPAVGPPLGTSRGPQPRAAGEPGSGTCSVPLPPVEEAVARAGGACSAETAVTFTVEGALSLSCPDWAPSTNGEEGGVYDIQGPREGSVSLPVDECTVTDFRGEDLGGGSWRVDAAMNEPFCYTPPDDTQWCIPNHNVRYVIHDYDVDAPAGTDLHNHAVDPGVVLPGPGENTATGDDAEHVPTPPGGWTAPAGEPVLETGTNAPYGPVYRAHWTPDLVVTIPPNAPITTEESPTAEYRGTLTTSVMT